MCWGGGYNLKMSLPPPPAAVHLGNFPNIFYRCITGAMMLGRCGSCFPCTNAKLGWIAGGSIVEVAPSLIQEEQGSLPVTTLLPLWVEPLGEGYC